MATESPVATAASAGAPQRPLLGGSGLRAVGADLAEHARTDAGSVAAVLDLGDQVGGHRLHVPLGHLRAVELLVVVAGGDHGVDAGRTCDPVHREDIASHPPAGQVDRQGQAETLPAVGQFGDDLVLLGEYPGRVARCAQIDGQVFVSERGAGDLAGRYQPRGWSGSHSCQPPSGVKGPTQVIRLSATPATITAAGPAAIRTTGRPIASLIR